MIKLKETPDLKTVASSYSDKLEIDQFSFKIQTQSQFPTFGIRFCEEISGRC